MTPSRPPQRPRTALSVTHWRTSRVRLAPRATRIANSRCRDMARMKNKLAMFTQAISKTSPTAANVSQSVPRTSLTNCCKSG